MAPTEAFFSGFEDGNRLLLFFLEMCRLTFLFGCTKVKLLTLLNKCWEGQPGLQEAPTSTKTSGLILGHALRKLPGLLFSKHPDHSSLVLKMQFSV